VSLPTKVMSVIRVLNVSIINKRWTDSILQKYILLKVGLGEGKHTLGGGLLNNLPVGSFVWITGCRNTPPCSRHSNSPTNLPLWKQYPRQISQSGAGCPSSPLILQLLLHSGLAAPFCGRQNSSRCLKLDQICICVTSVSLPYLVLALCHLCFIPWYSNVMCSWIIVFPIWQQGAINWRDAKNS